GRLCASAVFFSAFSALSAVRSVYCIRREAPVNLLGKLKALFSGPVNDGDLPPAVAAAAAAANAKRPKVIRVDVAKRFDLVRPMGQGSMSKVWQARDKHLGRPVCLKLLDKGKTARFEAS